MHFFFVSKFDTRTNYKLRRTTVNEAVIRFSVFSESLSMEENRLTRLFVHMTICTLMFVETNGKSNRSIDRKVQDRFQLVNNVHRCGSQYSRQRRIRDRRCVLVNSLTWSKWMKTRCSLVSVTTELGHRCIFPFLYNGVSSSSFIEQILDELIVEDKAQNLYYQQAREHGVPSRMRHCCWQCAQCSSVVVLCWYVNEGHSTTDNQMRSIWNQFRQTRSFSTRPFERMVRGHRMSVVYKVARCSGFMGIGSHRMDSARFRRHWIRMQSNSLINTTFTIVVFTATKWPIHKWHVTRRNCPKVFIRFVFMSTDTWFQPINILIRNVLHFHRHRVKHLSYRTSNQDRQGPIQWWPYRVHSNRRVSRVTSTDVLKTTIHWFRGRSWIDRVRRNSFLCCLESTWAVNCATWSILQREPSSFDGLMLIVRVKLCFRLAIRKWQKQDWNVSSRATKLVSSICFLSRRSTRIFVLRNWPGIFNVSMIVTNEYGRSSATSNLYRATARDQLYNILTYAG